jgi:CHAT domain-containing protein
LASKERIEADSLNFRNSIRKQQADPRDGETLFDELLQPIAEYRTKSRAIVVPDGELHLLPFNALRDSGKFVVEDHTVTSSPSATVFAILRNRENAASAHPLPYVGVAAWTRGTAHQNPILRSFAGPSRADLQPLPESRKEVETIAADLPKPSTILLGADATETHFKSLPLSDYHVLHLALHGFVDTDYPDRSALVFAPSKDKADDGMLQVREIRNLHLNARLVTLSACDTGVGPVGEDGIANIVNAFIEAGADSVVSTLWELEDHATEQLMATFYSNI